MLIDSLALAPAVLNKALSPATGKALLGVQFVASFQLPLTAAVQVYAVWAWAGWHTSIAAQAAALRHAQRRSDFSLRTLAAAVRLSKREERCIFMNLSCVLDVRTFKRGISLFKKLVSI